MGFIWNDEIWMLGAIQCWIGLESIRRRMIVSVSKNTSALRGAGASCGTTVCTTSGAGDGAAASTGCIVPRPVSTKDFS